MWVYRKLYETGGNYLYTVGFFSPDREWMPVADYGKEEDARYLVHYLNGGIAGRSITTYNVVP